MKWRWRGRGEVPALAELEMESLRLSWSRELRLERELRRLEVELSLFREATGGFTPRSHISATETYNKVATELDMQQGSNRYTTR